jgi:hypothetical protein
MRTPAFRGSRHIDDASRWHLTPRRDARWWIPRVIAVVVALGVSMTWTGVFIPALVVGLTLCEWLFPAPVDPDDPDAPAWRRHEAASVLAFWACFSSAGAIWVAVNELTMTWLDTAARVMFGMVAAVSGAFIVHRLVARPLVGRFAPRPEDGDTRH